MKKILFLVAILIVCLFCNNSCKQKLIWSCKLTDTIYIQPFYGFPEARLKMVNDSLRNFYHIKTRVLPYKEIYSRALCQGQMCQFNNRYSADSILKFLNKDLTDKNQKILGLTSFDIFSPKGNNPTWGIFGLGERPGSACIVSDYRLLKNPSKTNEFVINVVLHEIGHTFGLPHCDNDKTCLMNDAKGTIKTLYKEKRWFCPECRRKLEGKYEKESK